MTEPSFEFNLEEPIPSFLIGEINGKLAYVDERIIAGHVLDEGRKISLVITKGISSDDSLNIKAKAQRVISGIIKDSFRPRVLTLEDHLDRKTKYDHDPMTELMTRGEISREADGIYVVGPLLARLIDYFENLFLDLASDFKAVPYRFPTLIPAKYLEKVNYFKAFPHSLSFATHLRSDLDVIENFSKHACCNEHGEISIPMSTFSQINTLLSPAVCYHLYFTLKDKPLPGDHLAATAVGNCFRYESSNLVSLERLWNFTMREIIFVGPKEYVLDNRETARKRMEAIFNDIGFCYKVESANDPFFIGEFKQAAFQNAFKLKFEIRASLPFKNSTLAVGSYNHHQDFFGRSLNITLSNGKFAHTGCVAFGLERMAYAFLAQYGFDQCDWPDSVRARMDSQKC